MTRRVREIEKHAGEAYVELNPADADELGVRQGDVIRIRSRRGKVDIKARISRRVAKGIVFIPMHYREAAANMITNDAVDPDVKIPELKVCAVAIEVMAYELKETTLPQST